MPSAAARLRHVTQNMHLQAGLHVGLWKLTLVGTPFRLLWYHCIHDVPCTGGCTPCYNAATCHVQSTTPEQQPLLTAFHVDRPYACNAPSTAESTTGVGLSIMWSCLKYLQRGCPSPPCTVQPWGARPAWPMVCPGSVSLALRPGR